MDPNIKVKDWDFFNLKYFVIPHKYSYSDSPNIIY